MKHTFKTQKIYWLFSLLLLYTIDLSSQDDGFQVLEDFKNLERHSQRYLNNHYKFSPIWPVGTPGPGGGTIAYNDRDNNYDFEFLEMAPVNWYGTEKLPELLWHPFSCIDKLNLCEEVGCGESNTRQIIQHCDSGDIEAVRAVLAYTGNGKKDWFLPSYGELKEISKNVEYRRHNSINMFDDFLKENILVSNFEYRQGNEDERITIDSWVFGADYEGEVNLMKIFNGLNVTVRKNQIGPEDKGHILPLRTTSWNEIIEYWGTMDVPNRKALFDEAMNLYYNQYEDSDEILIKLTKSGTITAEIQLAICLNLWGDSVYKNFAKQIVNNRLNDLLLLANQGDVDAQLLAGRIYTNRSLGPHQPNDAPGWLKKAAENGNQYAMGYLAVWYFDGLNGLEKNINTARYWAEKGASKNNSIAVYMLGRINNSYSNYKRASDMGHPGATYRLALIYLNRTTNKEQNKQKAFDYLKNNAARLHQPSIDKLHELGYRFRSGNRWVFIGD